MPEDTYPGIVLGRELAKTLHVYVGDEITLVSPLGDLGPMGVLPKSRRFRVAATPNRGPGPPFGKANTVMNRPWRRAPSL